MHISHLISVNIFLENFDTLFLFDLSMKNLKTIVHNYNVFQVQYIVSQSIAWLQSGELRIAEILQTDGRTDGWMNIKCLSNGRKNLIEIFTSTLAFWTAHSVSTLVCNKLISTTAHESVNIISTKWFMHISHLISVNILDCRNLTDGRTNGRMDIKCLSNGRKNLITLKDQTKIMYQSSREICLRKSGVRYA
jgi:hypothetical protein